MRRQSAAGKPFFAFVQYTQAHIPTLPHPDFEGKTGYGPYADVIAEFDHRTGQILDAIDTSVFETLSVEGSVAARQHPGATAPATVAEAIKTARTRL